MTKQEIKQRILHYRHDGETYNLLPVAERYNYSNRIGIQLIDVSDGEPFDTLTTNLPDEIVENNDDCNFIKEDEFKEKFIKKFKLGTVLDRVAYSGYNTYKEVKFNLDKLVEHDDAVAYFDSLEEEEVM